MGILPFSDHKNNIVESLAAASNTAVVLVVGLPHLTEIEPFSDWTLVASSFLPTFIAVLGTLDSVTKLLTAPISLLRRCFKSHGLSLASGMCPNPAGLWGVGFRMAETAL